MLAHAAEGEVLPEGCGVASDVSFAVAPEAPVLGSCWHHLVLVPGLGRHLDESADATVSALAAAIGREAARLTPDRHRKPCQCGSTR